MCTITLETKKKIKDWVNILLDNIPFISIVACYWSNYIINRSMQKIEKIESLDDAKKCDELSKLSEFSEDELKKFNKDALSAKETIEEKAKANLAFSSLVASLTFGAMAILTTSLPGGSPILKHYNSIKWLVIISIGFLIQGVLSALIAMSYRYIYVNRDSKELENDKNNEVKLSLVKNIGLNDKTNLQRDNFRYLSFISIRNGLIALTTVILILFIGISPNVEKNESKRIAIENLDSSTQIIEKSIMTQSGKIDSLNQSLNSISDELKMMREEFKNPISFENPDVPKE